MSKTKIDILYPWCKFPSIDRLCLIYIYFFISLSCSVEGSEWCQNCSLGHFANMSGSRTCGPCKPGTFANVTGSSTCLECPKGHYQNDTAQKNCLPCQEGEIYAVLLLLLLSSFFLHFVIFCILLSYSFLSCLCFSSSYFFFLHSYQTSK